MMAEHSKLTLTQVNRDACSQVGGTFFTDYQTAKGRCVSPPQGNTNLHGSQTYVQPKPPQHQQQVN